MAKDKDSRRAVKAKAEGVVKEMENKYAKYYIKVMDKISQKADYASTEFERLDRLLLQEKVAHDKLDDFAIRRNIVKSFSEHEKGDGSKKEHDEL